MPLSPPTATTWAFTGTKGGTGTTLLSTSLGWALARQGLQVLLIDLDLEAGAAALHLCERNAGPTVLDALRVVDRLDTTLLDTLLTRCASGLRLLPAPREAAQQGPQAVDGLAHLIKTAAQMADFVLLDLPRQAVVPKAIDGVVLVGEPSVASTYTARRRLRDLAESGCTLSFLLNKVGRHDPLEPDEIRRALPLEGFVWREMPRSDRAAQEALHRGAALGACSPRDPLARALDEWAQQWARERARTLEQARATAGGPEGPEEDLLKAGAASGEPLAAWRHLLQRWAS